MDDRGGWVGPTPAAPARAPRDRPGAASAAGGQPVWWTDGHDDPWRDPATEARIVLRSSPTGPDPALEPVPEPPTDGNRTRLVPVALVTALLVGLVAGAVGGALGYRYGISDRATTVLGAGSDDTRPAALAQRPPESLAGVARQVLPSVVTVRTPGQAGANLGSGFVVTTEGHVITNDHVVGGSRTDPRVTFHDGESARAEVVGRDPESDIAVLRVDGNVAPPARLGDSDRVAVGDPVLAFGSPLALANTVTSGIVSAVDRTIAAGDPGEQMRYYAAIQTDAAVNQGNSGGPLVDAAGRVIGVNSVIKSVSANAAEAANIGLAFAIPISQAKRIAQQLIDTGQADRTVLGVELDRPRPATDGVGVRSVVPDGPADRAGLRSGDVLLRFDGRPLNEPTDLIALVRKHPPGRSVTVEYRRGGRESDTTVTLASDGG